AASPVAAPSAGWHGAARAGVGGLGEGWASTTAPRPARGAAPVGPWPSVFGVDAVRGRRPRDALPEEARGAPPHHDVGLTDLRLRPARGVRWRRPRRTHGLAENHA